MIQAQTRVHQKKTLQIATVGEEVEMIKNGISNFPTQKLILVAYKKDEEICKTLKMNMRDILNMEVETYFIANEELPHEEMFSIIDEILSKNKNFDIIINLGGGDKFLTCAAVASAFLNGLKAFYCKNCSDCFMLPILKLEPTLLISEAKMKILETLEACGEVKKLRELAKLSGYGIPLLSYHISSGPENLAKLGLVEIKRSLKGIISSIRITSLGRIVIKKRVLTV